MTLYTLEINIGFLWYPQMRETLRSYEWGDSNFTWKEGEGWITRTFYCRGSFKDIVALERQFYDFCGRVREYHG